jgi:hypothetical protein
MKLQATPTNPDLARNSSIEVERGQMKGKRRFLSRVVGQILLSKSNRQRSELMS